MLFGRMDAKKPPRTATMPEGLGPASPIDGPDLITAVREHGGATEFALLARQTSFTLGSSPSCDIVVSSTYVSSLHDVLERRGQRLRVHDSQSRNGTFFAGRRETTFDIGPGDVFTVGSTSLLAMNEDMRLVRPVMGEVLGFDQHAAIDELLVGAVRGGPLVLLGERGCGQAKLAQAIHDASLRRRMPLVAVASAPETRAEQRRSIDQASRGTLVLEVNGHPIDESYLSMAFSADYNVRTIVIAPTLAAAEGSVGLAVLARLAQVSIRPLRDRTGDVPALLDRLFLEFRASLRVTDLTPANQRALTSYRWPENLSELREAAERITGLVAHRTVRKAHPALGLAKSTLQDWVDRLELTLPLVTS